MKKYSIMLLSAVFAFAGCNKDNSVQNLSRKYPVFSTEMEETTKTGLGNDNSVAWNADDRVAVFIQNTSLLEYKALSGGSTCTELEAVGESGVAGEAISAKLAFYPYASSVSCAESEGVFTVNTTLSSTQTYKQGSFGANAAPMMAVTASDAEEPGKFFFKNVFGCLKLQFTGTGSVRSITVKGNNNEPLAGAVSVSMTADADSKPAVTFGQENVSTSITLDCGEGVALESANPVPFYICIPAGTYSKGFSISVTMADAVVREISTAASITVDRSSIKPMSACKLVTVQTKVLDLEQSAGKSAIKFCNSCYAYSVCNVFTADKNGNLTVPNSGSAVTNEFGREIRSYDISTNFWGAMGTYSPKLLFRYGDDNKSKGWTSLSGNSGTLCQDTKTYAETKFDDYHYGFSDYKSFGGRRCQLSIVVDLNAAYNVASIGVVNLRPGQTYGDLKAVSFYISNDDEFKFDPANGKDRNDYDYSNYANPNQNNWTLIAKTTDLPESSRVDDIQWVEVPYALLTSGKAKGRFLKIRFLSNRGKNGATGYSATKIYVKQAVNLD